MPETEHIVRKIPGGKLLRITRQTEAGIIINVKIRGDFFLYPEESVEDIEKALAGLPVEKEAIALQIEKIISGKGIIVTGFSSDELADMIAGNSR